MLDGKLLEILTLKGMLVAMSEKLDTQMGSSFTTLAEERSINFKHPP